MTSSDRRTATSSIGEGLDFGCQLLQPRVSDYGRSHPDQAAELLSTLCFYVETRYVGELFLALEALCRLARAIAYSGEIADQFWTQIHWVADAMELSGEEREELQLPPIRVTFADAE